MNAGLLGGWEHAPLAERAEQALGGAADAGSNPAGDILGFF